MADKKGAVHLTDADFKEKVSKAAKPVMVDFYAEWCGPCQMAAPVIDKLAGEYRDKIMIAKVNVDENQQTAQSYGVMSIPTVIVLKVEGEGDDVKIEEIDRKIGFPGEQGYVDMIESVLEE
jgi:thioredoxin